MKNNKKISKEFYIWASITVIAIILVISIFWFNYNLTTRLVHIDNLDYQDFLVKYYTNQNNWLNTYIVIVGIVLAFMGIIIPIDYKAKKEQLENIVQEKLANIDYIVSSYPDENDKLTTGNDYWAEIYKSKRIKQGGTLYLDPNNTFTERQLYFPYEYKTNNYSFIYSIINPNEDSHIEISIKEKNKKYIIFRISNYRKSDKAVSINWQASGF